jgi:hypothetical protein
MKNKMKPLKRVLTPIFLLFLLSIIFAEQKQNPTYYFAIEMNGILCGYSEMETETKIKDSKIKGMKITYIVTLNKLE